MCPSLVHSSIAPRRTTRRICRRIGKDLSQLCRIFHLITDCSNCPFLKSLDCSSPAGPLLLSTRQHPLHTVIDRSTRLGAGLHSPSTATAYFLQGCTLLRSSCLQLGLVARHPAVRSIRRLAHPFRSLPYSGPLICVAPAPAVAEQSTSSFSGCQEVVSSTCSAFASL